MWCVRYGSRRRVHANHRSGAVTDYPTSKPGATTTPGMSPSESLLTGWAVSGIEMARARSRRFSGTAGTRDRDVKGESQVKKSKAESTDARAEDGPTRSSVEASVMGAERRGRIASVELRANFFGRMSR
jgi:hypothetical protein